MLLAMRRDAPASVLVEQVVQRVLDEQLGGRLDYYSEHLDVGRFSDPRYLDAIRQYLKRKYSAHSFDLVVAPTNAAADFVRSHRDELFPGTPVVYSAGPGVMMGPNTTGLTHTIDLAATLHMLVRLQPEVRTVYVLSGASISDRYYVAIAREQLRQWEHRLSIVYWSDLSLGEALRRASTLPSDAVLYAMPFTEDSLGHRFNPVPTLQALTAAASVPVYHFSDLAMGHGVVGGALLSTDKLARGLAEVSLRVLRGERASDIPVAPIDVLEPQVDWRQLQRWGISEARLPAGTIVHFREPGLWERYWHYVLVAAAVSVAQSGLIGALLVQRRRRRRIEQALRLSSHENQQLAGRLISAQEAERARIARDLHDDASQELASLAMSLSVLKARLSAQPDVGAAVESLGLLQRRTVTLGESLRTLSHELHPAVLKHVGIVGALKSHCADFERVRGIRTTFEATGDLDLEIERSLCLYRVAQEALNNAARHARASSVAVSLGRVRDCAQLSVRDDGVGFEPSQRPVGGLGLRSIDERVRLHRGSVTITSTPGHGTLVFVSVPVGSGGSGGRGAHVMPAPGE